MGDRQGGRQGRGGGRIGGAAGLFSVLVHPSFLPSIPPSLPPPPSHLVEYLDAGRRVDDSRRRKLHDQPPVLPSRRDVLVGIRPGGGAAHVHPWTEEYVLYG